MNKKARWYTSFIHKVLLAAAVAAVLGGCAEKEWCGAGDNGTGALCPLDRTGD